MSLVDDFMVFKHPVFDFDDNEELGGIIGECGGDGGS